MGNFTSVFTQFESQFEEITLAKDRPSHLSKLHLSFIDLTTKIIIPEFPSAHVDLHGAATATSSGSHMGARLKNIATSKNMKSLKVIHNKKKVKNSDDDDEEEEHDDIVITVNNKFPSSVNHHFFNHLPLLYCLDRQTKDGRVCINDVRVFSEFVGTVSLKEAQLIQMDFEDYLKAMCLVRLKKDFCKDDEGKDKKDSEHDNDEKDLAASRFVRDKIQQLLHDDNNDDAGEAVKNACDLFSALNRKLDSDSERRRKHRLMRQNRNVVVQWILEFLKVNTPLIFHDQDGSKTEAGGESKLQDDVRKSVGTALFSKQDEQEVEEWIMSSSEDDDRLSSSSQNERMKLIVKVIFWRWHRQMHSDRHREHFFGRQSIELLFHILNKGTGIDLPCGDADDLFDMLSSPCTETAEMMIRMIDGIRFQDNDTNNHEHEDGHKYIPQFITSCDLALFLNDYFKSVFEKMKEWDLEDVE